ncbi:hypothetical protein F4774DRAFT_82713 [Daldinia eschscholtzii]|nr:hypothetical protein F4774DRAFT_82713 [Daldinia eschscholtzii]
MPGVLELAGLCVDFFFFFFYSGYLLASRSHRLTCGRPCHTHIYTARRNYPDIAQLWSLAYRTGEKTPGKKTSGLTTTVSLLAGKKGRLASFYRALPCMQHVVSPRRYRGKPTMEEKIMIPHDGEHMLSISGCPG